MRRRRSWRGIWGDWGMFKPLSQVELGLRCLAIKDGTHGTHPRVSEGVPLLSAKNISGFGEISFDETDDLISEKEYEAITKSFPLETGDVLLTVVGSLGRSALFTGQKVAFQRSVAFLRPDQKQLVPRFLYHAVRHEGFKRQLTRRSNATAQAGIYLGELARCVIPDFNIGEQQAIADILDTLDTQIRQTEAIIAKLQQVKQGLLHDLLTRGIDANGQLRPPREQAPELYKESPLGWIPREWEMVALEDVADVSRGKFTHRPRNDPRYFGGVHPFIQTGDVAISGGGIVTRYFQTLSDKGVEASKEFPAGSVAVTIAANIADTGILGVPMYFPDSVVGVVVNSGVRNRYVELVIRSAKRRLDARAPQSAQKNINLQDLRPLPVPLPSYGEQNLIAERYETFDTRLTKEKDAVDKLKQQKSGLMDDLLTGRVRVTQLTDQQLAS